MTDTVWVAASPGDRAIAFSGRVARMIRWVCDNSERVEVANKGEIRFCFAKDSLAVHVTEVDSCSV